MVAKQLRQRCELDLNLHGIMSLDEVWARVGPKGWTKEMGYEARPPRVQAVGLWLLAMVAERSQHKATASDFQELQILRDLTFVGNGYAKCTQWTLYCTVAGQPLIEGEDGCVVVTDGDDYPVLLKVRFSPASSVARGVPVLWQRQVRFRSRCVFHHTVPDICSAQCMLSANLPLG